jgi:hypothetical protein
MLEIVLALLAVSVAAPVAVALGRKRRAARRAFAPRLDRSPAGLKHLAAQVSDLSDLGFHLPSARSLAPRRRLGVLLGLR